MFFENILTKKEDITFSESENSKPAEIECENPISYKDSNPTLRSLIK